MKTIEKPLISRVILALDNMNEEQVKQTIQKNKEYIEYYKIGLEQFCRSGPEFVKSLNQQFNVKFFLDLKLHDIPKTVSKAIESLKGLPISFLTIHLAGGAEMVKEALAAAKIHLPETLILGVSVLTSLDDQAIQDTYGKNIGNVTQLLNNVVRMGSKHNLQGLVCSIQDLDQVYHINPDIVTVCPGIRFEDQIKAGAQQDQKRVATPELAKEKNSHYLVIGRAITQANSEDEWKKRIQHLKAL